MQVCYMSIVHNAEVSASNDPVAQEVNTVQLGSFSTLTLSVSPSL